MQIYDFCITNSSRVIIVDTVLMTHLQFSTLRLPSQATLTAVSSSLLMKEHSVPLRVPLSINSSRPAATQ